MDPVAQVVVLVAVVALAVAGCVAVAWRRARSVARRQAALDAEVARSRAEVESLSRRVEELSEEVVRARRLADEDREYVITSLGDHVPGAGVVAQDNGAVVAGPERRPVARLLEDQVVQALSRRTDPPPVRRSVTQLAVRTLSVAHGVRRALSPDVLDRAAAEAHVARRRSRRERKREIREARKLLRAVSTQRRDQDVA